MSVRDLNKSIIVTDGLNGDVLEVIYLNTYSEDTIFAIIKDLIAQYVITDEHGLLIKIGYKK